MVCLLLIKGAIEYLIEKFSYNYYYLLTIERYKYVEKANH